MRIKDKINTMLQKKTPKVSAIVAAGGSSERMKGINKLFYPLGGVPLISYTIQALADAKSIQEIIIATKEDNFEEMQNAILKVNTSKKILLIKGGSSRQDSVNNALNYVSDQTDMIAIHDGDRPFISAADVDFLVQCCKKSHAVAPALPMKDTIKEHDKNVVIKTLDRNFLCAVQTPQVFDFALYKVASKKALQDSISASDDCSVVEHIGMKVLLVDGNEDNIKVTTPFDLLIAETIFKERMYHDEFKNG